MAGRAKSITVEEVGESGAGIEFVVQRNSGVTEAHQVKRQRGNANSWSVRNLRDEDVLSAVASQVTAGRQFHFVSIIPARPLDELTDRARRSDDVQAFVNNITKELREQLDLLITEFGSTARTFDALRGLCVRCIDERELQNTNAALAEVLVSGAPGPAAAVVLGDLVSDNLGRTLDAPTITKLLGSYELDVARLAGTPAVQSTVQATYDAWEMSVERELLAPEIPRSDEASAITTALQSLSQARVLVAGAAGAGKSAVLHQAVTQLKDEWPILAIRLDRIESFSSTHELGVSRLGLPGSPVSSLAAAANGRDCLLVIDQLDAVSRASGRMPGSFDAVADLVRETRAFPNMRVLLACRQFDLDNDDRLRGLVTDDESTTQIAIPPLTDTQVAAAISAMQLNPTDLSAKQLELLRIPLHLVLLAAIADQDTALTFTTSKELMDAFYDRKRHACRERRSDVHFADTLGVLVDYMSDNQRLTAPEAVLDSGDLLDDADILASEHVVVRESKQIAFFHEAFFDYVFARRWIVRGETVVAFLTKGEQELFRRAQVRQILVHLRDEDPGRFIAEVDTLLKSPEVRFHIKEVVLAILRALPNPTQKEWQLVNRHISGGPLAQRLRTTLRTGPWFERLDAEGIIEQWLASRNPDLEARALEAMIAEPEGHEARLAQLLAPHVSREEFPGWLRWVTRFSQLGCSRELFDLVLDAVRAGNYDAHEHELWLDAHDLGGTKPEWAAELLGAWLIDRPGSMALGADGRIVALASHDYQAGELIDRAATGAPATFAGLMVPFLLSAMAATSEGERRPKYDRHFAFRTWNNEHPNLAEHILAATSEALKAIAENGSGARDELLQRLAADQHDAAQWLLYQTLIALPEHSAWAATLLLEGEHRLECGYTCSGHWTTRQLLVAISPEIDDAQHEALERAIISLKPEWETPPGGYVEFTLLSGLGEGRLSKNGRLRLGELRRRFDREQPTEPMGIHGGIVQSPIPQSAAQHMTDEQWLRAVAKYDSEERDWGTLKGGPHELGQVLEAETKSDPARFARLGLKLDAAGHPAYIDAILRGLGTTDADVDPTLVFAFIRHVASLARPDDDRSLASALGRQLAEDIPDDIIELVIDRALRSSDPESDAWLRDARGGKPFYGGDPLFNGINTARGASAITLGDLLAHDTDGHRTALAQDAFAQLAADPSVAVRACVAHVLTAGLRYAQTQAIDAFATLIQTDDRLLATRPVEQLIVYIGFRDATAVAPVVVRMIGSEFEDVREAGGRMAAFSCLELEMPEMLRTVLADADRAARKGAAETCAHRLPLTGDAASANHALKVFVQDENPTVRGGAAQVAGVLRDRRLAPHQELLLALIASPSFSDALPQLLLTLERAPDRVDELILAAAQRFVELYEGEMDNISTRAAGDAGGVGELVLRAYAQADNPERRHSALDLIDKLLEHAAYGFSESVGAAER